MEVPSISKRLQVPDKGGMTMFPIPIVPDTIEEHEIDPDDIRLEEPDEGDYDED